MPTWPATLPTRPIAGSLQFNIEPNLAEFRPEAGGSIKRRRYTVSRRVSSAIIELDGDQIEILRAFFSVDLADGVRSFDMSDWWSLTQGAPTVRSFTFEEPPVFTHHAVDRYRATVKLATMV